MRKFRITHTLFGNTSSTSFTAWANSPDLYEFTFNEEGVIPENLTGKTVGVYLLVGSSRIAATCRRPLSTDAVPDTAGVTVVDAAAGRIDFKFLPTDILVTDTALWLEFWADAAAPVPSSLTKYMLGQFRVSVAIN